jgi:hypothetical protein
MAPLLRRMLSVVDRLADPNRRLMRSLGLVIAVGGLVGAMSVVVVAATGLISSDTERYRIEEYITDDPSAPPESRSTDDKLWGVGLGTRVEVIDKMFPPDDDEPTITRFGRKLSYEWHFKGLRLVVEVDPITRASTGDVSVYGPGDPGVYASLPRHLLLGYSTMADALRAYKAAEPVHAGADGDPDAGLFLYDLDVLVGASLGVQFSALADLNQATWGRWHRKACGLQITHVGISARSRGEFVASRPAC